ncbi:hypothetical protein [Streptomyces sp. NPDC051001]|uniref:hypothetical protein n=1 Tax=Streptomyces sp. NPDC051001 TaxID=3155795 RepID=UPI0034253DEB
MPGLERPGRCVRATDAQSVTSRTAQVRATIEDFVLDPAGLDVVVSALVVGSARTGEGADHAVAEDGGTTRSGNPHGFAEWTLALAVVEERWGWSRSS